jgi:hypothetical protein
VGNGKANFGHAQTLVPAPEPYNLIYHSFSVENCLGAHPSAVSVA